MNALVCRGMCSNIMSNIIRLTHVHVCVHIIDAFIRMHVHIVLLYKVCTVHVVDVPDLLMFLDSQILTVSVHVDGIV